MISRVLTTRINSDTQKEHNLSVGKHVLNIALPATFLVVIISIWQIIVTYYNVPSYFIPSPAQIGQKLWDYRIVLLKDLWVTSTESVAGFLLGSAFAILSGAFIGSFSLLQRSMYPILVASQAIPVIAIAPIIIIWFGNGLLGKTIMAAMICYFPVAVNTVVGVQSTPTNYLDLFRTMAASNFQTFWKLRVPFSLPYVFTGLRVGAALSPIGAIVAELAGAQQGLGYRILISSYQLDTPLMFAALLVACVMGVVFFYTVSVIGTQLTKRVSL